ncbi:MAG: hypothetical protein H6708_30160 [Kofleriaceae bacterium]|nr:hypothetical protein [Myxococcales bacterium]MCB9564671.1 hypothetical protein [Kofleriaceae bacterium]
MHVRGWGVRGAALAITATVCAGCFVETWAGAGSVDYQGRRESGYRVGLTVGTVLPGPVVAGVGLGEVAQHGDTFSGAGEALHGRLDVNLAPHVYAVGTGHIGWWRNADDGALMTQQEGRMRGVSAGLGIDLPWAEQQRLTLSVAPAYADWDAPNGYARSLGGEVRLRWLWSTFETFWCQGGKCATFAPAEFGSLTRNAGDYEPTPIRPGQPAPERSCTKVTTCTNTSLGRRCTESTRC